MMFLKCFSVVLAVLLVGCQADPGPHLEERPLVELEKNLGPITSYNPAVDILFIIDDSGSMSSYQDRLAINAGLFMDTFLDAPFVDYHIGVTSSSADFFNAGSKAPNGKLHQVQGLRFVTRETKDAQGILSDMLNLGISGSGAEKFLSIPQLTFSESALKGANKGFLRDNAHLLIFVLTDTHDQSDVTPQETFDFLAKLKKNDLSKLHFVAAGVSITKSDCDSEAGGKYPSKIYALADLFQGRGHRFNICKSNYGEDLAEVATSIVQAVSTIFLDSLPDVRTIQVKYGDQVIPNQEIGGWVYDFTINAIHLSPQIDVVGEASSLLSIQYDDIYEKPEVKVSGK